MVSKVNTMPRPQLMRSYVHPYHITSRSYAKEFFPIPIEEVWEIMLQELYFEVRDHGLAVHAFILMGNHFHLLCKTPRENIDQIMQSFLRKTSIRINSKNPFKKFNWEGRYRWSLIDSKPHYYQVYRYIFQNSIRAQLCLKVEDYKFSTLHPNFLPLSLPIHACLPMAFGGNEGHLRWLNEIYEKQHVELIKLGLRRHQFDINKRKIKIFNKLTKPLDP
jgi:putative transposase